MTEFEETARSSEVRLELAGVIDDVEPVQVYQAFTDSGMITTWWADEAKADPVVGGHLVVAWPSMGWTMRGRFTELVPDERVEFTWSWDHEPETPTRLVRVNLTPESSGTRLVLAHGDYEQEAAAERLGHLEGWQHFLGRIGPQPV